MITHTTIYGRDGAPDQVFDHEYRMSDRSWGKYDSGFHAWLVEQVEADDWAGDTDYGGAVLYGRFVDYWSSIGFHSLVRFDTRDEARAAYEAWSEEFYAWEDEETD